MNLTKLKLIYHTVKYLRFKQVYYRLYYAIRNRFFKKNYSKKLTTKVEPLFWENKICYAPSYLDDNTFNFLNINHQFKEEIDWNYNGYGKLWTYNLNYFDFLNQKKTSGETGISLIENYIENDTLLKDGKEPYPTSLRTINWIKFLSKYKIVNVNINQALYNHYQILLHNLEYHILANHLLENAFALFFGSYYFKDKILAQKATSLLIIELNEQILNDGAHFELSPMYHQIILHRLLDCISLMQQNDWDEFKTLSVLFNEKAIKMLSWLESITFTNGDVPMVNDSTYNIALTSEQLYSYAKQLNLQWYTIQLSDSGYRKFVNSNFEVFMDVGQLGISYQPGHAHADTFSFVLHVNNHSVIVDPGVSTYEINKTRKQERSTAYHNTVTINELNSSQVWSGFRVAKRAEVNLIVDNPSKIMALHNGYPNYKHTRSFTVENESFIIEDLISNKTNAKAHFHLHPDCELKIDDKKNIIFVDNVEFNFLGEQTFTLEEYNFAKGFNSTLIAKKIVVLFSEKLITTIKVNKQ